MSTKSSVTIRDFTIVNGSFFRETLLHHDLSVAENNLSIKKEDFSMNATDDSHQKPQLSRLFSSGSLTEQKSPNKRRFTISGWQDTKSQRKRRRINSVALPTKFLLGGNIKDPLNLRSLEDEEVNRQLNALTPASSPLPVSQHRTQVQILVPTNIYDPLNLNTGEEIEFNINSQRVRKRKRHRRTTIRKEIDIAKDVDLHADELTDEGIDGQNDIESSFEECSLENQIEIETVTPITDEIQNCEPVETNEEECCLDEKDTVVPELPATITNEKSDSEKAANGNSEKSPDEKNKLDKIVSPVVPQGSKFFKRTQSITIPAVKSNKKRQLKKKCFYEDIQFKPQNSRFSCGSQPYKYHCSKSEDVRFKFLDDILFSGKIVLDIGCNVGCVSSLIAEHYQPKKIVGCDIDSSVIRIAQQHLLQHLNSSTIIKANFPASLSHNLGPLYRFSLPTVAADQFNFLHNVSFFQENYVLNTDEDISIQQPEYDVILCLRVTKWIHLNWGDDGLKRSFKRMFAQLKWGGQLILEPQPWQAYAKAKKLTETIYSNYGSIELKPEKFIEYLLSKEVGFTSCKLLGRITNQRGYQQSLYVLDKVMSFSPADDMHPCGMVSPIVFNDIAWARSCDKESNEPVEWDSHLMSDNISLASLSGESESSQYNLCSDNDVFFNDSYFFSPTFDGAQDLYESE